MSKYFFNRTKELAVLRRFINGPAGSLAVVYGRRRCGKSTLLQKVLTERDIYFLADIREPLLQVRALAHEVARRIEGFDGVEYPSWDALFSQLNARATGPFTLVIDEYPYLEQMTPGLSSVLQNHIDRGMRYRLIICGSSQRLMQGLILDSSTPLYGRASEILKVRPLEPGWIMEALHVAGVKAVESYSIWGGVPRYWELAKGCADRRRAITDLVLDRNGILHDEPGRILQDDMRTAGQPNSIVSLIAGGCHRLSEIAARLGKPAASLARPLDLLLELGYVRREIPFGESIRSTRRSLYRLDDPFLLFWYRFVEPNRSVLERDLADRVYAQCKSGFPGHVGAVWEQLARISTAVVPIDGIDWKPADRYWGNTLDGMPVEIDLMAESFDGTRVLIGEAKWQSKVDIEAEFKRLERLARLIPNIRGRKVSFACWIPDASTYKAARYHVVGAEAVMNALR